MCLSSDSMGAYVHSLSLVTEGVSPMEEMKNLSATPSGEWCVDESDTWHGRGVPGISIICISAARGLWPRALGCPCAMEDGPSGGV